jgi:hypothetical protein
MGALVPLIFMTVLGGGIAAGIQAARNHAARTELVWKNVAAHHGLDHAPGTFSRPGRIGGRIRGIDILVTIRKNNSNNNQNSTFTVFELRYPPSGPDVRLTRQGALGSFFRRLTGGRDVLINDPVFDDSVIIDGADQSEIGRFLTPTRRMAVLSLLRGWTNAEVTNRSLKVEKAGHIRDPQMLSGSIVRLVDMGLLMSAPDDVDHALLLEQRGDMAAAVNELHSLNESAPNSFVQMLEAEALVAMGDRPGADAIFEQVQKEMPADPEIQGWRSVTSQPGPPPMPQTPVVSPPAPAALTPPAQPSPERTEATTPTPPAAPAQPDPAPAMNTGLLGGLSAEETIDDLFGTSRMGYEVEERFSLAYRDRQVTWSGTIDTIREFRTDNDFGREPGIKATVRIGSLGDSQLVTSQIHAIVHLPAGTDLSRNDEITFTGTLIRVDRYMRNLYVALARPVPA